MSNFVSDLMTGGLGSVIETVGKAASDLITTDKERLAAENEAKRIDAEVERAYLKDTDSARQVQIAALQQNDIFAKRFVYWFAIAWSLFAMAFFIAITYAPIPERNVRIADTILGFLIGTAIAQIFNFFLGTSLQSRNKDNTIPVSYTHLTLPTNREV